MHEKQYAMGSCLQTFGVSAVACKVSLVSFKFKGDTDIGSKLDCFWQPGTRVRIRWEI